MKQRFMVTGMTCTACSAHVEKAVSHLPGVTEVQVNLLTGRMTVDSDPVQIDAEAVIRAVTAAGYGVTVEKSMPSAVSVPSVSAAPVAEAERPMRRRLLLSLLFLLLLMAVSMGHMVGLPLPDFMSGHTGACAFALTQLLLCLPIVYLNRAYYEKGLPSLFHGSPNMETLISVGSLAALVYGVFALYRIAYGTAAGDWSLVAHYHGELYFESAGMILTLVTLGKYLETRAKKKTTTALEKLIRLTPETAVVERDGCEVAVPATEVQVGDTVIVRSGAHIPVDGVVTEGEAAVEESAITGESLPVSKSAGDTVIGATVCRTGYVKFRATRVGADTTLSQIIRLVEESGSAKAPIARTADAVASVFVPAVMLIALISAVIWLIAGQTVEFSLSRAICVLVISCPCALGLATPVAIMVGTGKGAENGILIKSGEALEIACKVNCVVLDKTGTITGGRPVITDCLPLSVSESELLQLAADLESKSEHPLSEAVLTETARRGFIPHDTEAFSTLPGRGVNARCGGHDCLAGNEQLMTENGITVDSLREQLNAWETAGKTPLLFARDGVLCGMLAAADVLREESREAIAEMRSLGVSVWMLTGDRQRTAEAIARQLSLDGVIAEVLPQEKEREIVRLRDQGYTVAMVGDGINDAPALVSADVGMAIGSGTDIAVDSADIVLMKSDLRDVPTAIRLSRAVVRNIRQNLFWAFFYNILGIPLAAGAFYPAFGWLLSPMIGTAAMSFSSLFVVSNALRLRWFHRLQTPTQVKKEVSSVIILTIDGMMCEHCQQHVEQALKAVAGDTVAVDLATGTATVCADVSADLLKKAVTAVGYTVTDVSTQ